jgi:hypothetical protein
MKLNFNHCFNGEFIPLIKTLMFNFDFLIDW